MQFIDAACVSRVNVPLYCGQVHGTQAQINLLVWMLFVKGSSKRRGIFALLQLAVNAQEQLLGGCSRLATIICVLTGRRRVGYAVNDGRRGVAAACTGLGCRVITMCGGIIVYHGTLGTIAMWKLA